MIRKFLPWMTQETEDQNSDSDVLLRDKDAEQHLNAADDALGNAAIEGHAMGPTLQKEKMADLETFQRFHSALTEKFYSEQRRLQEEEKEAQLEIERAMQTIDPDEMQLKLTNAQSHVAQVQMQTPTQQPASFVQFIQRQHSTGPVPGKPLVDPRKIRKRK